MGYKGTYRIEEEVLRLLKQSKMSVPMMAQRLQKSENSVQVGISHLRKNVLKPNEAIVTHLRAKSKKPCEYELITTQTSRLDGINQGNRIAKKTIRSLREITKLVNVLVATTNPTQVREIKLQIASILTKVSGEFNMANLGILPTTNQILA
jgi:hypothetical protein